MENTTFMPVNPDLLENGSVCYLICLDIAEDEPILIIYRVKVNHTVNSDGYIHRWYEDASDEDYPIPYAPGCEHEYDAYHVYTRG